MKAQFCPECGAALDNKGRCQNPDCVKHTTPIQNAVSKSKPTIDSPDIKNQETYSEKDKLIVPDCIKSDLDEVPIKQYDIARLQTLIKGAFAEGRLQVTNKRVLFRSSGRSIAGPTSMQFEFSIEEIAGIEIRKESRFNFFTTLILILMSLIIHAFGHSIFSHIYNSTFLGTVFMILLAVASIFLFFILKNRNILRHVALSVVLSGLPSDLSDIVSVLSGDSSILRNLSSLIVMLTFFVSLLFLAFAPNLVLNIKTKGGTPSVEIRRKDGLFSFQHNEYTGFSQVMPGPDIDLAMHELGAVIREVQQTGIYSENQL